MPIAIGLLDAIASLVDRMTSMLVSRIADAAWRFLHLLGAHHWRDGYEVDLERGWRQYRGSRCTICDAPWEGW